MCATTHNKTYGLWRGVSHTPLPTHPRAAGFLLRALVAKSLPIVKALLFRSTAATAGKALFFRSFSQSPRPPPLSHSPASLQPFLDRQGTVILDGDLSTALGAESERHALSGAQHLFRLEGHNKLLDLHRTFLEAGSDVISSLSYQVSFEMFTAASTFTDGSLPGGNITAEKNQLRYSNDVLRTSVELAKKARNDFWSSSPASALHGGVARLRPLVAASVGPAGDNVALWMAATEPTTAVHGLPDEVVSRYYRRKLLALCRARPELLTLTPTLTLTLTLAPT